MVRVRAAAGIMLGVTLTFATTTAFAQQSQATAQLRGGNGQDLGTATVTQEGGGIRVVVNGRDMPPGVHGIHFHEVGRCDPPAFMSAGEHYNPTGRQHGLRNPNGPHAADLPNLTVAGNGTAQYSTTNTMLTLGSGSNTLFDADGSSLVIHANADDEVTDPSGNSGGRIACGVLERATGAPVQVPTALPATGDVARVAGAALPLGVAGASMLLAGFAVRRRRG